jgi:hypothetical protein
MSIRHHFVSSIWIILFYLSSFSYKNVESVHHIKAEDECFCRLNDLIHKEKRFYNYDLIRIEYADGKRKYSSITKDDPEQKDNNGYKYECDATAIYETIVKGKRQKRCSKCVQRIWTDLLICDIIRCDRLKVLGQPILKVETNHIALASQELFDPGLVVAEYKYGSDKFCKICNEDGEWTRFSLPSLCTPLTKVKKEEICVIEALKDIETTQPEYIRLHIESKDGIHKLKGKFQLVQPQFT